MPQMSQARLIVSVLLPFAAGYYLSYLFRSINALIAGHLTTELGLGAADLGLLTSVYFLVFAAVVLPCGVLLDRYGPRLIDSALLLLAAPDRSSSPLPTAWRRSSSAAHSSASAWPSA